MLQHDDFGGRQLCTETFVYKASTTLVYSLVRHLCTTLVRHLCTKIFVYRVLCIGTLVYKDSQPGKVKRLPD